MEDCPQNGEKKVPEPLENVHFQRQQYVAPIAFLQVQAQTQHACILGFSS